MNKLMVANPKIAKNVFYQFVSVRNQNIFNFVCFYFHNIKVKLIKDNTFLKPCLVTKHHNFSRHISAVPEILMKRVPQHFSTAIFGNQKQFPFSYQILGTRKMIAYLNKREIRDWEKERKPERKKECKKETDGWTDGQTDRQTDSQPAR